MTRAQKRSSQFSMGCKVQHCKSKKCMAVSKIRVCEMEFLRRDRPDGQEPYLGQYTSSVCKECVKFAKEQLDKESGTLNTNNLDEKMEDASLPSVNGNVSKVIRMLDEGVINDSDKNLLLKALAKSMSKDIKDDMDLLKGKYSEIDKFSSNPADFLQQRPSSLISFLSVLTGIEDVARVERKK